MVVDAVTFKNIKSENSSNQEKINKSQFGVIRYNISNSFNGYNLYSNKLMDMDGNIVHSWQNLSMVLILDNNDIVGITNVTIGRYGWDSNLIWRKDLFSHHELIETSEGNIMTISRETHEYKGMNVTFDTIYELSADGKLLSNWSTFENLNYIKKFHMPSKLDLPKFIFDSSIYNKIHNKSGRFFYDYYHINSVQSLPDTEIGKKDKRFQKGNWLVSLSFFDLIVILDKDTKEIVWSWGHGKLDFVHMPRMLDNGNILIFDNGELRGYSRVIELDPIKKKILWKYESNPPESFFSRIAGSAQKLPNGNTLIGESMEGHAFEVTKNGNIVWEWLNPEINAQVKRERFYRITRLPKEKIDALLAKNQSSYSSNSTIFLKPQADESYICSNCNVILISFDALRADHLGIYGYGKNTSPNIDKFAKTSYVFRDSLSQCGSTSCSLPSLFTSKFPAKDNILKDGIILKPGEITIAEILKKHNYSTKAVVAHEYAESKYGLDRGFDFFDETYQAPEKGNETILRVFNAINNTKKPFFLWVHLRQPHSPYDPEKEIFEEFYENPYNNPTLYASNLKIKEKGFENKLEYLLDYYSKKEPIEKYVIFGKKLNLTKTIIDQYKASYDGNIKEADNAFGFLLRYLEFLDLSDSTIIIITSDHGESLGEHNVFDHNNGHYGTLHTPLIFHLPNNEHQIIEEPVMNIDIFPAIIDTLGIRYNDNIRGKNLFGILEDDRIQLAEVNGTIVKLGKYKLEMLPNGTAFKLFNVFDDPSEQNNLINKSPETIELIEKRLSELYHDDIGGLSAKSDETLDQLKALGYAS